MPCDPAVASVGLPAFAFSEPFRRSAYWKRRRLSSPEVNFGILFRSMHSVDGTVIDRGGLLQGRVVVEPGHNRWPGRVAISRGLWTRREGEAGRWLDLHSVVVVINDDERRIMEVATVRLPGAEAIAPWCNLFEFSINLPGGAPFG